MEPASLFPPEDPSQFGASWAALPLPTASRHRIGWAGRQRAHKGGRKIGEGSWEAPPTVCLPFPCGAGKLHAARFAGSLAGKAVQLASTFGPIWFDVPARDQRSKQSTHPSARKRRETHERGDHMVNSIVVCFLQKTGVSIIDYRDSRLSDQVPACSCWNLDRV